MSKTASEQTERLKRLWEKEAYTAARALRALLRRMGVSRGQLCASPAGRGSRKRVGQ